MEPVDLLVFGPHPDDLEIGLGGTIAKHAALGHRVGLCDLTAGEMGSNGTVDERIAEAEDARAVLGALWRINLRWPDRAIGGDSEHVRAAARLIREARPRAVALPYWSDRHPDHGAASSVLTEAVFNAGLRRFDAGAEAWRPAWTVYYFINDSAPPSFVVDVSEHYERKRTALACHKSQFTTASNNAVDTRLTSPLFSQLVESRDAQFGAQAGVRFAEGLIVRQPVMLEHLLSGAARMERSLMEAARPDAGGLADARAAGTERKRVKAAKPGEGGLADARAAGTERKRVKAARRGAGGPADKK